MAIEIESRFDKMMNDITLAKETARNNSTAEFRKKIKKRQLITMEDREKLYQMVPVDDVRTMKVIPSKDEILSDEEPFLRPNLINGPYPSSLTYLDVQFRLLREDFLAPLRDSVKEYFLMNANDKDAKNKRPAPGTIRIYRDVELHKVKCTMDATLFTMKFSTFSLKRVKWENSKRLLPGSLLLLTPDRFKSIYFATVGRRDERTLPHGLIDIIWEGNRPDTYDGVKFLMIECEVYFESYRHTLRALQIMAEPSPPHYDRPRLDTYKMAKYIVNVTKDSIPSPEYLHSYDGSSKRINFGVVLHKNQQAYEEIRKAKEDDQKHELPEIQSFEIDPMNLSDWPSAGDIGMDTPQYLAFQAAMTQELALIQGPPGTGKTYIGLQIMKMLLANNLGSILVVCYTNHALDQFLEGILSIMDLLNIQPYGKLVRVGGQSKNDGIQQYNIASIRGEYLKRKQFEDNYASLRTRTRRELVLLEDYRSDLKSLFSDLCYLDGIIMEAQRKVEEVKNQGDGIILKRAQVVGMTTTGAAKYNTVLRMMQSKIVIVEEAAEVLESHIVTSITEHCQQLILIGDHQQLKPPTTVYKLAKDYQLDVSLFERLIKNDIRWQYLRAQHRMRPEICKLLVPTIYPDLVNHSNVYAYPPVNGLLKNIFFVNHSNPEKADNDSMTKSNEYEANYVTQLCRYLILQGYKASQITILTTYIGQMFLIKRLKGAEGDTCRDVRVTVVDNFQGEENDIILLSLVRSNEENKIGFLRTDNRICVALSRAKQGLYIVGNMDCLVNSPSNTWKKISEELQEQESIGSVLKIRCQNHQEMIEINSPDEFQKKSPEGGCTKMCPGILPRCDHACRNICHIRDRLHEDYRCPEDCERRCPDPEKHKCAFVCHIFPCPRCEVKMKRNLPCGHVKNLPCHVDIITYSCELLVDKQLKCGHVIKLPCSVPSESHRCIINVHKDLGCGHQKLLPCPVPVTEFECVEKVTRDLDCGHPGIMKCIDDPSKFNCTRPISRLLPCGHEQEAPCVDHIASIQCVTMCEEVHPDCNHKVQVPCHQLQTPEKWKCLENCDVRLNCGHQCVKVCHLQDDPDHLNYFCQKNCARSCENGHKCRKNHQCHKECEPCNILTDKLLSCDHRVKVSCSVNEENLRCKEPCRKMLACGHECLKKCYMVCDPCVSLTTKKSIDCPHTIQVKCHQEAEQSICNELTASTEMSLCGHVVNVPCRIASACSPEDCVEYCHKPCGYKFDYDGGCGHTCQGDCASCHQGRIHVKCNSKCERVLACGHVCKFPCSSLCPPCSDVCLLRCQHSKCKKKCGQPCTDCKESCKRSCKHSKCQKKCSEICNRDPCSEPCEKKMKCGHDCIGCCGEPCPPYCRSCDKEIVQEVFFGQEDEEDARFVYLENCGHIVHRESMDKWMSQNLEESERHQITVKRCPKCSRTIMNSARYGNVIKKQIQDVLGIRKKIYGNDQTQKRTQQLIAQKIQRSAGSCQFDNVREFLAGEIYQMRQSTTKRGREMVLNLVNVDQYTFETLHNIVLWWEEAENNLRSKESIEPSQSLRRVQRQEHTIHLRPESRSELLKAYKKLFEMLLIRKFPLSSHEVDDFDQEFIRTHDLHSLFLRRAIEQFDSFTGSLEMYNSAHKHLMQIKPYDEDMQKKTQGFLKNLEDIIKIGWESVTQKRASDTRINRQNIFKAMGFAGNHWYRCSNGHLYTVADCGALNQSGVCPECRTAIGRGSRNAVAVRDEAAIQQQINSVVDIFPAENHAPPVFRDRNGNSNRDRPYRGYGRRRRGRY
ncbi:hypothetical protein HA402_010320 [Bradysia odoriphaga]|nr:hypothetical protein HA402_010320 [Bradysia odoriphaga]